MDDTEGTDTDLSFIVSDDADVNAAADSDFQCDSSVPEEDSYEDSDDSFMRRTKTIDLVSPQRPMLSRRSRAKNCMCGLRLREVNPATLFEEEHELADATCDVCLMSLSTCKSIRYCDSVHYHQPEVMICTNCDPDRLKKSKKFTFYSFSDDIESECDEEEDYHVNDDAGDRADDAGDAVKDDAKDHMDDVENESLSSPMQLDDSSATNKCQSFFFSQAINNQEIKSCKQSSKVSQWNDLMWSNTDNSDKEEVQNESESDEYDMCPEMDLF